MNFADFNFLHDCKSFLIQQHKLLYNSIKIFVKEMSKSNIGPVRRVRVHYSDGKWSIAKERIITRMVIPNSQPLTQDTRKQLGSGFWFEVSNTKGELVYRRRLRDMIKNEIEVPNKDGTFTIVPFEKKDMFFEVLIPEKPENVALSFYGVKFDEKERKPSVRKLIELKLEKIMELDKDISNKEG